MVEPEYSILFGRYRVDHIGTTSLIDQSGLVVTFDEQVEESVSSFQIGAKTLVSRIGGIIGVGKELFWILTLSFTVPPILLSLMKN